MYWCFVPLPSNRLTLSEAEWEEGQLQRALSSADTHLHPLFKVSAPQTMLHLAEGMRREGRTGCAASVPMPPCSCAAQAVLGLGSGGQARAEVQPLASAHDKVVIVRWMEKSDALEFSM